MAVRGKVDHGGPRQSRVQPGKAGHSQVKTGTARYSHVQPGTVMKRSTTCYIFEKQAPWGYQILYWKGRLRHQLGPVWSSIWGMSELRALEESSGTTSGEYCQQWTTISGATCICDAVISTIPHPTSHPSLKVSLAKRYLLTDTTKSKLPETIRNLFLAERQTGPDLPFRCLDQ